VVYGGTGKAARSWEAFDAIVASLRAWRTTRRCSCSRASRSAVFRTHTDAPRVLIANSNLVPRWANWEKFRELERQGLTMYGQMTAGSWIYIGTQGILQGTYETFAAVAASTSAAACGAAVADRRDGRDGRRAAAGGDHERGRRPRVEVDPSRIERRIQTRYCDRMTRDLDEALRWVFEARDAGLPLSSGLVGNCAEVLPELVRRGVTPDVLTDQTSAHDALVGYVPPASRWRRPTRCGAPTRRSTSGGPDGDGAHCEAMLEMMRRGAVTFDYGNNLRTQALDAGFADAFEIPGFVPAYVRPLFCEGKGPFRWVALSGDPADIHRTDDLVLELFPDDDTCAAGSPRRARRWRSRGCRRASAGWGRASARSSAWR
jgi:urocanate hydratase